MKKSNIIILLFCLLAVCLTGCNTEEKEASKVKVDEFLSLYQSLDSNAGTCLANQIGNKTVEFNGMQAVLAKRITYETGRVKKKDDYYQVRTTIQNVDFIAAFEALQQELDADTGVEEILRQLQQNLEADDAVMREFILEVPVQKNGDTYEIVMTSELSNALFGGYNEYLTQLTGGIQDA